MSVLRLIAIVVIFGCVSIAWMILGGSIFVRTEMADERNSAELANLWGPPTLVQAAPYWTARVQDDQARSRRSVASSDVRADIRHNNRYKGLLWYSTFTVDFVGRYTVEPPPAASSPAAPEAGSATGGSTFCFPLPPGVTTYDKLNVQVNDKPLSVPQGDVASGTLSVPLSGPGPHAVSVTYSAGGQESWLYVPGGQVHRSGRRGEGTLRTDGPPVELRNFSLTIATDFREIDYPRGSRSPSQPAAATNGGMTATWTYEQALTNQAMGVVVPQRPNAGPIAARMAFFAPVSLLFFFTVLFAVVVLRRIPLHPMHYLFIAAGFFAFHILLAYLVDLVDIHAAFWICAAVSVFLVVSYMRLVAGMKFAATFVAAAQLVFLVGFSYAFFWEGRTGLVVTIAAIATLFVLMQATGRVNWSQAFNWRRNGDDDWRHVPPPVPPVAPPEP